MRDVGKVNAVAFALTVTLSPLSFCNTSPVPASRDTVPPIVYRVGDTLFDEPPPPQDVENKDISCRTRTQLHSGDDVSEGANERCAPTCSSRDRNQWFVYG